MTVSFGLKTTPSHTTYADIARVWREADEVPEIEHAWLFDHLTPLFGPPDGPILEGWTLLAALAAQTSRLRLGLMVTDNRIRPPAVLAKMAATVDVVSAGRLVVGLGVGGTHQPEPNPAVAEFAAYGLTLVAPREGLERLAETCVIMRRLWTEEVVDFDGPHTTLVAARCEPKPVQRPGPPIMIGGWGDRTLRLTAEHADIWNIPGPPHRDAAAVRERSERLDAHCAAIGRDPASLVRSVQTHVSYVDPAGTVATVRALAAAGITHVALNLRTPFPPGVARWVADNIIKPFTGTG